MKRTPKDLNWLYRLPRTTSQPTRSRPDEKPQSKLTHASFRACVTQFFFWSRLYAPMSSVNIHDMLAIRMRRDTPVLQAIAKRPSHHTVSSPDQSLYSKPSYTALRTHPMHFVPQSRPHFFFSQHQSCQLGHCGSGRMRFHFSSWRHRLRHLPPRMWQKFIFGLLASRGSRGVRASRWSVSVSMFATVLGSGLAVAMASVGGS